MKKLYLSLAGLFGFAYAQAQIVQSFPYQEDFESFSSCTGSCNSACTLGNGWLNESASDNAEWTTDAGGTSSSSTGPGPSTSGSNDFNPGTSTGKYLYVESSSPCFGTTAIMYSPEFDFSATIGMEMVFAYHMWGSTMGTMTVEATNDGGATWTSLWSLSGDQGDQWYQDTISLVAYAGDTIQLRWVGLTGSNFYSDMAIDDIQMYELLPNDAGVVKYDSPGIPACSLGDSVWVTIHNYGTDTLTSVIINWEYNGSPQTPVNWTGNLANNEEESVFLGTQTIVDNDTLFAYTSMPNGLPETGSGPGNDGSGLLVKEGLSGTYFIGNFGYPTFNAAVADLTAYGVCGPTTFIVDDGLYNEQVTIPEILNASTTNTIKFQSLNGSPNVNLTFTPSGAADDWTLKFDGADYITFKDITISTGGTGTYSAVVNLQGGASYNTLDSCTIVGAPNPGTTSYYASCIYSYYDTDSMNTFKGNYIVGGSFGMYYQGTGTTDLEQGTLITGNIFEDYYYMGMYMYYQNDLEVSYNESAPSSNYSSTVYRYYTAYCDGKLRFHHNKASRDKYGYGAYFYYCDAFTTQPGYIYNNSISVGDPNTTSISYGLAVYYCNNHVIANNSVNLSSNGTSSRALYHYYGGNNRVFNNNFVNDGPGYGIYTYGSPAIESDNNNYYVPNGTMAYNSGSTVNTLADWQSATGLDLNSYDVDPAYPAFEILTTCHDDLDKSAIVDSLVVDDFTGTPRSATPDIGAFEFDGITKFSIGEDTAICSIDVITLGDPASQSSWIWNTAQTTNTITVSSAGTYIAQISNSCGVGVDTTTITHLPDPTADFDFTTSFLTGEFFDQSAGVDTWLWTFGDGGTSTLQDPVHVYTAGGTYVVTLTINGICGSSTFTDTVTVGVLGTDDMNVVAFNMYPNPADETVTLTAGSALNNAVVEVMDAAGRVVASGRHSGTTFTVNVEALEAGTYFIRITDADRSSTKPIMIK